MEHAGIVHGDGNGTGRPIIVEVLSEPEDSQLFELENAYLAEIEEESMTQEKWERLRRAIREGRITFFLAKHGGRTVGMCSAAACFSTFNCSDTCLFEDFYVVPAFRGKGAARELARAAQRWCAEHGIASLTVCCAPCDEGMYQGLGFDLCLGRTFARLTG